ncbi:MAG: M20/M25/M40 family metallo-hydrolase [Hyphomicrobiales bacterium]|nr:M20/M25/M40 family metallo-hydrolase [Hyphomicrobiales bacterium]
MVEKVLERVDRELDHSVERLFELLRIASISTDPAYRQDCRAAALWCADALGEIGFDASVRETQGLPIVVGHAGRGKPGPHVLFYGHYDVQPPDPLALWETPPFEPRRARSADGSEIIVARGASDDKGQLMTFLEACRAFKDDESDIPVPVTVLLEGEEECGSKSLEPFIAANEDELKADVALVCDTAMWNAETPAITSMLRGLLLEEVIVTAASRDLHSGMFGGPALNPIHVLALIIAGLHGEGGRVVLPDFYDGVGELPDEVRAQWEGLDFDETKFLADIGLGAPAGEADRGVLEKLWSRPTCDVNGIIGGYTGEGSKTVIPAKASAKFSFRLVGGQDPERISKSFREFVRARLPVGCTAEFIRHGGDAAISFSLDGPYFEAARKGLAEEFGKEAALIGCGGSIPIVGSFKRRLKMDSLLVGFGLDDDRIHSPNEKYNLSSFHHGMRSWVRILDALKSV